MRFVWVAAVTLALCVTLRRIGQFMDRVLKFTRAAIHTCYSAGHSGFCYPVIKQNNCKLVKKINNEIITTNAKLIKYKYK